MKIMFATLRQFARITRRDLAHEMIDCLYERDVSAAIGLVKVCAVIALMKPRSTAGKSTIHEINSFLGSDSVQAFCNKYLS